MLLHATRIFALLNYLLSRALLNYFFFCPTQPFFFCFTHFCPTQLLVLTLGCRRSVQLTTTYLLVLTLGWVYLYMHNIYIYTYVYVHIYIYTYIDTYIYMYMYIYMYIHK